MKLSTKGRYGLAAVLFLAKHADESPLSLRKMGETGIQADYLEQLLGCLRRSGLVHTSRGAQGGYSLARKPEEITIGDVIAATEGPVCFSECALDASVCSHAETCEARPVWADLSARINGLLESITLADVLTDCRNKEGV